MERMKSAEGRHEEEARVFSLKLSEEIAKFAEKNGAAQRKLQISQTALARNAALTDALQRQAELLELMAEDAEKLIMNLDKVVSATAENLVFTEELAQAYERADRNKAEHLNDLHEIKCKTQAYQMDLAAGLARRAEKHDQLGLIREEDDETAAALRTSGQDSALLSAPAVPAPVQKVQGASALHDSPF